MRLYASQSKHSKTDLQAIGKYTTTTGTERNADVPYVVMTYVTPLGLIVQSVEVTMTMLWKCEVRTNED